MKMVKMIMLGSLLTASSIYAASTAACLGCHGQNFEKKALGVSKVVKDMSKEDIVKALEGYKNGTYGGAMKSVMAGQVKALSSDDIKAMADAIKGGGSAKAETKSAPTDATTTSATASTATAATKVIDINKDAVDPNRISKEDLGNKKEVTEEMLGLRKTTLFDENVEPAKADYSRGAPGAADRFERAYVNAPPMIPHSVDGLLPITGKDNKCLGCHMPNVAKSMGATPIPPTHFTNYRPTTVYKNGELIKEGKVVGPKGDIGNVGDIKIAKAKKLGHLYQGRYNCSQCHAPQAKVKTVVANTFKPDGLTGEFKTRSKLMDMMDDGVK